MEGYFYRYITEYEDDYIYMFLRKDGTDYIGYYLENVPDNIRKELENKELSELQTITEEQFKSMNLSNNDKYTILKNKYNMILVIHSVFSELYQDYTII